MTGELTGGAVMVILLLVVGGLCGLFAGAFLLGSMLGRRGRDRIIR
jgi:hypothetical protein